MMKEIQLKMIMDALGLDHAEKYLNDINALDEDGATLLYLAAKNGAVDLINLLVELGGDINLADEEGWTPVYVAALGRHVDAVAKLVELGASLYTSDINGWTIAHSAARRDDANLIGILSKYHVKIDTTTDSLGATPVYFAAQLNHQNALIALLDQGVNFEIPNKYSETPLHAAAENGFVTIMGILLDRGANREAQDENGKTPLVIAAENNLLEAVKLLVAQGANVNALTDAGKTALYIAASKGHTSIVQYLLQQNDIKMTPIYYSAEALKKNEGGDENKCIKIAKLIEAKLGVGCNIDCIPVLPHEIAEIQGHDEVVGAFQEPPQSRTMSASDPYIAEKKVIFTLSQYALVKLSFLLGYSPEDISKPKEGQSMGECNGVTAKWIEACLLGDDEETIFNHYLDRIHRDVLLFKKMTQAKENKTQQKELTSDERELLNIANLCKSIRMYQSPRELPGHPNQLDLDRVSVLAGSEKIKALGGLAIAYSEPGIYTEKEMAEYFDRLGQILEHAGYPPQSVIGVALTAAHVIGLTYQVNVGWKLLDINDWPAKKLGTIREIARRVFLGFNQGRESLYAAFNAMVITTADDKNRPQLTTQLELFKKSHVITKRRAERFSNTNLAFLAAMTGDLPTVLKLAEYQVDFNRPTANRTPLMMAVLYGHAHLMPTLVNHGANIYAMKDGCTIATLATSSGDANVLSALADLGVDLAMPIKDGFTIVHLAALLGHAHLFLLFEKYALNINAVTIHGDTPAHTAAEAGHLNVILELARLHANFDIPDRSGETPICRAAWFGYTEIVKSLTEHGADYNVSIQNGDTPLFYAARNGHCEIVQYLLQQPNIQIKPCLFEISSLRSFVSKHEPALIARMEQFIQTKLQNSEGQTQLSAMPDELASIMGHDEIVRILNEYKERQIVLPLEVAVPTQIDQPFVENPACFFNASGKLARDLAPVENEVEQLLAQQKLRNK